ncbi:MAG TPA: DUF4159 domain-containing protein [Planctomicrobium sp.]|nr:DUF4159 domain-containing protein [Planctomicrobium sp.]
MKSAWSDFLAALLLLVLLLTPATVGAAELYLQHGHESVALGRRFLLASQHADGAFPADGFLVHPISSTAVATLALLKSGVPVRHESIQSALHLLWKLPDEEPMRINELALLILVLNTVQDTADRPRLEQLVNRLVAAQLESGSWPHRIGDTNGDLSASQFALLALRDVGQTGRKISPVVWSRSHSFWTGTQLPDGGWPEFYNTADRPSSPVVSSPSGTLAGVAMLTLCERNQVRDTETNCCDSPINSDALKAGRHWLETHCRLPGSGTGSGEVSVDHLYGIERATRPFGALFSGEELWFRRAAVELLRRQHRSQGYWPGNNLSVSTSYALIFLGSGVTPSVVNTMRLESGSSTADHPQAIWNLNERFLADRSLPRFHHPHELDLSTFGHSQSVPEPFLEAPVLFLTGNALPRPNRAEITLLKSYLNSGGLIFAAPECSSMEFETGLRELAKELAAPLDGNLTRVPSSHFVYRSRFELTPDTAELWELNTGCRTLIFYSPTELPCQWDRAISPELNPSEKIGINVLNYAIGSQLPVMRDGTEIRKERSEQVEQGLLNVALVQHSGGWNVAPDSLRHLLRYVNEAIGPLLVTEPESVRLDDPRLSQFPILYWHGNRSFKLTSEQRRRLRTHLDRGGVLLADACCGSAEFDHAFRSAMSELFPDRALAPIPYSHELFSTDTLFDLTKIQQQRNGNTPTLPVLEGIEHAGRYVVIYSRSDLSCAWEVKGRHDCTDYQPSDALKIGANLIVYALKQDLKEIPLGKE